MATEETSRKQDVPTIMLSVEDRGDPPTPHVEFRAGDGGSAQPWYVRNQVFEIAVEWEEECKAERVLLTEFRPLDGGPPWHEAHPGWGVFGDPDVIVLTKGMPSPVPVTLFSEFPFPKHRLVKLTVTVELRVEGSPEFLRVSFVDPWDEVPCP